jgi:hypothetical protein
VVVKDLEQLGLVDRCNGLTRLVVVNQNELQTRGIEHASLVADPQVVPILIHDEEIVVLLTQNAVQQVPYVGVSEKLRDGRIGRFAAGRIHKVGNPLVAEIEPLTQAALEEIEQAQTVD